MVSGYVTVSSLLFVQIGYFDKLGWLFVLFLRLLLAFIEELVFITYFQLIHTFLLLHYFCGCFLPGMLCTLVFGRPFIGALLLGQECLF